jgi:hypothetical protein
MDCTIMALPSSAMLPPNTALSIYDSSEAIDDWLRQMSASNAPSLNQGFSDFNQQQAWPNRGYPYPDNAGTNSFNNFNHSAPMLPYDPADSRAKRGDYPSHQRHRSDDNLNIDPRLLPPGGPRAFLDVPGSDSSRSRSPSTSSQSSHHGPIGGGDAKQHQVAPYRPTGRVQGMFDGPQGMRAAPQLNMNTRTGLARGPSTGSPSSSLSPSPGSAHSGGPRRAPYGRSPSSAHPTNGDGPPAEYGPSLAGLHIY